MNTYEFFIEKDIIEIIEELNKAGLTVENSLGISLIDFLGLQPDSRVIELEISNPGMIDQRRLSITVKEDLLYFNFNIDIIWLKINQCFNLKKWNLKNNILLFCEEINNKLITISSGDYSGLFSYRQNNIKSIIVLLTSMYYGVSYWGKFWKESYESGELVDTYKELYIEKELNFSDNLIKTQIRLLYLVDYYNYTPITLKELWIIAKEILESYNPSDEFYKTIDSLFYLPLGEIEESESDFIAAVEYFLQKRLRCLEREKIIYESQKEFQLKVQELIRNISEKYGVDTQYIIDNLSTYLKIDELK